MGKNGVTLYSLKMQEYEYFHNSQEGQLKFGEWLGEFDWSSVLACPTPSIVVITLGPTFQQF